MSGPIDVAIVDAHHHLARLDLGYPWLSDEAPLDRHQGDDRQIRKDYLVGDYRADAGDLPLVASVHVENGASDALAEARWIGSVIADNWPTPAAHVARADLSSPDVHDLLERYASMAHVRGVRHILNWHPNHRYSYTERPGIISETAWRGAFSRLAGLGLSFDLQVYPDQLEDASRLAEQHTDTTIILDHVGMPLERDPDYMAAWSRGLRTLAKNENVTAKISAIGMTDHRWTIDTMRPVVEEAIDAFGTARVMFASNFPVDGLYSSMADLYGAFASLSVSYTRDERADMFGRTAAKVYRLGVPGV